MDKDRNSIQFKRIVKGFETGYTNGFTEGKNNKIKVLKKRKRIDKNLSILYPNI